MKDNRKRFYMWQKKNPRENESTLLNELGELKIKDVEITKVLQTYQEGDWELSAWISKGEIVSDQHNDLLPQNYLLGGQEENGEFYLS